MRLAGETQIGFGGSRRAPEHEVAKLIADARHALKLTADREWQPVRSRMKLKKILFEVEERSSAGMRCIIGKRGDRPGKSKAAYAALRLLWDSGFRPPNPYTVTEPLLYLEDIDLLLQEKAPGAPLFDSIRAHSPSTPGDVALAARWLAALHSSRVPADPWKADTTRYARCSKELCEALSKHAERIARLTDCALDALAGAAGALVPAHGDFHPMNVFVDRGRVTAIDFDTFGARERAADVAYFLSQTLIMGYLQEGNFDETLEVRRIFLREYNSVSGEAPLERRLCGHMALAFVQSLHFELCILHTGNMALIQPWLGSAERCLNGDILLT